MSSSHVDLELIFDRTDNSTLKMMALLDECSHQALVVHGRTADHPAQVLGIFEQVMIQYGAPGHIRSANGPANMAAKVR